MSVSRFLSLTDLVAIAHRGGSKLRPENTIAAFDHGLGLGADGLECDVHLSRDGEVVVIHDATLERTTDAAGPVGDRTADELSRVDAGYHFGADEGFPYRGAGFGVPRLRDLLDRYTGVPIVIEVKGDRPEVAERAIDVVRDAGAEDRVILAGFNQAVVAAARAKAPEIVTSAAFDEARVLMEQLSERGWPASAPPTYRLFQVPFRFAGQERLTPAFVRAARDAGLPVQAWIVDDADDMERLIGWGVTGIISDRPDVAVTRVAASTQTAVFTPITPGRIIGS